MSKYIIEDNRTKEEIEKTCGFVVATDKFMSGWGAAPHISVVAIPFISEDDRIKVMSRVKKRSEMKRVRVVYGKQYKPRLSAGDHLHIYDTTNSFRYTL
jgi:hypothetical protein